MKAKTKNVEPNSGTGNRALFNTFRFLSFSFLSFCFLTSLVDAQTSLEQLDPIDSLMPYLMKIPYDVNIPSVRQMWPVESRSTRQEKLQISSIDALSSTTGLNRKLPNRDLTIPGNKSNSLGRQLWWAGISAYQGEKDRQSKSRLRRIIEQVRSIEFKSPKQTVEPVIIVKPVIATVEPNETSSHTEVKEESEKKTIEPRLPYEPLTDRTLQLVGNLAQHPERSENPFALGEVLYHSGHLKEAAVFYQEALKRKGPDETGSARNRAWILFQIGNCLRDDDPLTAKKMYGILIAEYSDSPWIDLARAREGLIGWQQKDKPLTLIAESKL